MQGRGRRGSLSLSLRFLVGHQVFSSVGGGVRVVQIPPKIRLQLIVLVLVFDYFHPVFYQAGVFEGKPCFCPQKDLCVLCCGFGVRRKGLGREGSSVSILLRYECSV